MSFPRGLCAYPVTPADSAGRVDSAALRRLVERLRAAGVDGIGLLGSTGTYMYLSREERRRALEAAMAAAGETPILVGIGALRTDEVVKLAQDAKAIGAAAGLLAPVSYTPLTEDEVFLHYETAARESGLPICVYDNPAATHFRFSPELLARLSRVPGVVGAKSPAGTPEETAAHRTRMKAEAPEGFSLGVSMDWNAAEALLQGAEVWHSVLGGILPEPCLKLARAAQAGEAAEARRLNAALEPLWAIFREFSSLRTVYALGGLLGLHQAEPPRPILPLPEAGRRRLEALLPALTS